MSFYSYKNAGAPLSPGNAHNCLEGLREKVCVQVTKVYDSCIQQEQLDNKKVQVTHVRPLPCEGQSSGTITPPITFESCRSLSTKGIIRNLCIDRLCDRPNFARVKCSVDIPIDVLFVDSNCKEGVGRGVITIQKDVLLFVPEESIVPFRIESLVSAVCVSGTYCGNDVFSLTVCVTVILKVVAEVELLIPSYGFCPIPPCEEFSSTVCDEFFSLPLFPEAPDNAACERQGNCLC